jgi:lipopolysaccharide transport system ATP-binding protein
MSDVVITIEDLSKCYLIGHQGPKERYQSLRDTLSHHARNLTRRTIDAIQGRQMLLGDSVEEFWALKNVTFEVKQGDVLGIIGRNGAGKSTLLKVLSRITDPTQGRVTIDGRVASLLEVGTGFHPELTGRENIFLNGTILGMSKREISAKFDEIVAFAGVETFLDTPVKRYSSGMYVRLAFAVAAHLEPEILIIDEVLAVGDAEFQKKCLGKMKDVAGQGRTVLFVSHQIASVTRLCNRVLWLDQGQVSEVGDAEQICSHYLANGSTASSRRDWNSNTKAPGNEWVRLEYIEALANGKPADGMNIDAPLDVVMSYRVLKEGKVLIPNLHFYGDDGTLIFISHDWDPYWREKARPTGAYRTTFTVPGNFFSEGRFVLTAAISTYLPFEVHFVEQEVVAFNVVDNGESGGPTSRGDYVGHLPGLVRPLIPTTTEIL